MQLLLAANLYKKFAAFSAFDGSKLVLVGRRFCKVFTLCALLDVALKILTTFTNNTFKHYVWPGRPCRARRTFYRTSHARRPSCLEKAG